MTQSPVILFEPICRGSRLQILANTIAAIREHSSRPIKVVSRADYDSCHFRELMNDCLDDVQFFPATTTLGGEWIKILDSHEMESMLLALEKACEGERHADVIFMALDEYLKPLLASSGQLRALARKHRFFVVKYRVEYMLAQHCSSLRAMLLRVATLWLLFRLKARLVCFDERFVGRSLCGTPVSVIPDPWFGDFNVSRRDDARTKHSFTADDFVVLTIGRQDRRKGFPIILNMLADMLSDEHLRLFVVGKIAPEYSSRFAVMKRRFPERIKHIDQFVDEAELPDIFACADVFLLPYATDFTSTSGTLPRAAASGVPVVTGRHGLVGFRVREAGLGETCDISSPESLLQGIRKIQSYGIDQKSKVLDALATFAASAHITRFKANVGTLFASENYKVQ